MTVVIRVQHSESGFTLIELMISLIVLSIGVLALWRLFPQAERAQMTDRMSSSATYYAQQQMEILQRAGYADTALAVGRHPTGTASIQVGPSGRWQLSHEVTQMSGSLSDLKKVAVTVTWPGARGRSVVMTTYMRP